MPNDAMPIAAPAAVRRLSTRAIPLSREIDFYDETWE